ncbi:hypothetical protein Tco_0886771 [Tanacetum coccineum]
MGLWYPKDTGFKLTVFSDSDNAGYLDTCKSTSGGIQFLGGEKLVTWSSKKQDCTSMSTAEAEYVSLSAYCAQVLWMQTQLAYYCFHIWYQEPRVDRMLRFVKTIAFWSCVLSPATCLKAAFCLVEDLLAFCLGETLPISIFGCVLSKDITAFCFKTSLRFASRHLAFCLKTSLRFASRHHCVLLQDILRFVKTSLRFV